MPDYTSYLLRGDDRIAAFRQQYATFLRTQSQKYIDWVRSFPVMKRIDYLQSVPERNIPAVIGMLCILLIDGHIHITFHDGARTIHRDPGSIEEWEAWCDSLRPPRRTRKKKTGSKI